MASLHALSPVKKAVSTLSISSTQSQLLNENDFSTTHKWAYLISNQIQFSEKRPYSIRLPKPETKTLMSWLEKIVLAGQCANIFVEDLSIDEVNYKRIKQLCVEHHITLVNLSQKTDTQQNVIQGPW